jgi:hypothetical protein
LQAGDVYGRAARAGQMGAVRTNGDQSKVNKSWHAFVNTADNKLYASEGLFNSLYAACAKRFSELMLVIAWYASNATPPVAGAAPAAAAKIPAGKPGGSGRSSDELTHKSGAAEAGSADASDADGAGPSAPSTVGGGYGQACARPQLSFKLSGKGGVLQSRPLQQQQRIQAALQAGKEKAAKAAAPSSKENAAPQSATATAAPRTALADASDVLDLCSAEDTSEACLLGGVLTPWSERPWEAGSGVATTVAHGPQLARLQATVAGQDFPVDCTVGNCLDDVEMGEFDDGAALDDGVPVACHGEAGGHEAGSQNDEFRLGMLQC